MPKLTRKLPAYSLHKPSGHARVRHLGRDCYLGVYGSRESHKAYARLIAEFSRDTPSPPTPSSGPTVADLILRFWSHSQGYYRRPDGSTTGEHLNIRCALKPLRKLFGATPAAEFRAKQLRLLRDEMIRLGWSRRYVNDQVGRVKRMFSWGVAEEMIPETVTGSIINVKGLGAGRSQAREKAPVEAVADGVVDSTLPHLPPEVADIVRLLRLSGARIGEILTMTPDRLDRSDPTCWVYTPTRHKSSHKNKARTIFLGPRAIELLSPYLIASGGGLLFGYKRDGVRQSITRACDRAFPHPRVLELETRAKDKTLAKEDRLKLQGELEEWVQAHSAELEAWRHRHRWHPHQLRHAAATEIRARFGLEAAQVVLGHSAADVTQIYAATDGTKAREAMKRVG